MYVDNSWLSLDPIYLSLLRPHEFSDMDGFQDGGYIWAQGVLQYNLIKVPCLRLSLYPSFSHCATRKQDRERCIREGKINRETEWDRKCNLRRSSAILPSASLFILLFHTARHVSRIGRDDLESGRYSERDRKREKVLPVAKLRHSFLRLSALLLQTA